MSQITVPDFEGHPWIAIDTSLQPYTLKRVAGDYAVYGRVALCPPYYGKESFLLRERVTGWDIIVRTISEGSKLKRVHELTLGRGYPWPALHEVRAMCDTIPARRWGPPILPPAGQFAVRYTTPAHEFPAPVLAAVRVRNHLLRLKRAQRQGNNNGAN